MKSYSETTVFRREDLELLAEASRLVAAVPDPPEGASPWRCHELARAVGAVLGLRAQDGRYGLVDHTWLWVGEPPRAVLDVYAVGRLPQVQLASLDVVVPWPARSDRPDRGPGVNGYAPGDRRDDLRFADVDFLVSAARRAPR